MIFCCSRCYWPFFVLVLILYWLSYTSFCILLLPPFNCYVLIFIIISLYLICAIEGLFLRSTFPHYFHRMKGSTCIDISVYVVHWSAKSGNLSNVNWNVHFVIIYSIVYIRVILLLCSIISLSKNSWSLKFAPLVMFMCVISL